MAGWLAQLAASAFNQLSQYANSLVTGPTVTQNSPFSSLAVAVTIASTHFAYPQRDDQAELVEYQDSIPTNGHPSRY